MRFNILLFLVFNVLVACDPTGNVVDPGASDPRGAKKDPRIDAHPGASDPRGAKKDPRIDAHKDAWGIFNNLAPLSNEMVLIERAADYLVRSKKEPEYLAEVKTEKGQQEIKSSVENVMKSANFKDILTMFKNMLPVHRCQQKTFEGINRLGYFLSSEILFNDMRTSELIKPILSLLKDTYKRPDLANIIKYTVVLHAREKYKNDPSVEIIINYDEPVQCTQINAKNQATFAACLDKTNFTKDDESKLISESIDAILNIGDVGINYHKDKEMKTDRYVFSVVGFNNYSRYGNIILPLDASLIQTAWSTPLAATYFNNSNPDVVGGKGPIHYGALSGRVWVEGKDWSEPNNQARADFESSKIKGDRESTALVFATEMLARVMSYHRGNDKLEGLAQVKNALGDPDPTKSFEQILPSDIRKYMKAVDAHALAEMHFPPFKAQYINKVVLFDDTYNKLEHPMKNIPNDKFEQVVYDLTKTHPENVTRLNTKAETYSAP